MAAAWLIAALFGTGAVSTYVLPTRSTIEWIIFLAVGLICGGLAIALMRVIRRGDELAEDRLSIALIAVGAFGFLQRVYFSYHGPLLHDPDVYIFRPILSFLPFISLAALALSRTRIAVIAVWLMWGATAIIVVSGFVRIPDVTPQRDGVVVLALWLLIACPLFHLLLQTLPPYEDVLRMGHTEIRNSRATAALTEQLRESELRFRMAMQGLQVGVWENRLGRDGARGSWWGSDRFYELLGYTPEALPPTSERMLELIHPDDREAVVTAAVDSLERKDRFNFDMRLRTGYGGYRWFNARANWQRGADGSPERLIGGISDIHDRIEAERALRRAQTELERLAYIDSLTEAVNRRGFDQRLRQEVAAAQRSVSPLSLLLLDLDYFKRYNDHYGHAAGDRCLRQFAALVRTHLPSEDALFARIGGEEFALLLPAATLDEARAIAGAIHRDLATRAMPHADSPRGVVTCSIGIATRYGSDNESESLFKAADRALYAAKGAGRNTICTDEAAD